MAVKRQQQQQSSQTSQEEGIVEQYCAEGKFFHNTATKLLWLFLQPLFYSLRPLFVRPKPLTMLRLEPVLPAFLAAAEYVIAVNILRLCVSAATAAVKFKVSLFCEQWILVHK